MMYSNYKQFPDSFTIFHSGRVSSTKSRGGGVLIAIWSRVPTFKRRYDLQLYEECFGSKFPPKTAVVYLLVITFPLIPNQTLFLNIFVLCRKP
jgi:hypothetical protein